MAVERAIAEVIRREWSRVVGALMRDLGDLDLVEDAVQDATEAALATWPDQGVPDRPGAWITTVARRRAIDRLRRERTGRDKAALLGALEERLQTAGEVEEDETVVRDDQLRLMFGCCHPALRVEDQMALTLRSIGGLTTGEIAKAFLVPESTMAQRLVRAKRKIAGAGIPFIIPPDAELLQRLSVVRGVLYLIFNEGYDSSFGEDHIRVDLCDEAIRLARLLARLVDDDAENHGLLALFLLSHARRHARVGPDGEIVLLDEQDRTLWDRQMIDEGTAALDRALRLTRSGPLQLQAAIAALHADAGTAAETDWHGIADLYAALLRLQPTPVVRLNHLVAVAMSDGAAAGLDLVDDGLSESLSGYSYFHAALADLYARTGRVGEARAAYDAALALTDAEPERRLLRRKQGALGT